MFNIIYWLFSISVFRTIEKKHILYFAFYSIVYSTILFLNVNILFYDIHIFKFKIYPKINWKYIKSESIEIWRWIYYFIVFKLVSKNSKILVKKCKTYFLSNDYNRQKFSYHKFSYYDILCNLNLNSMT